MTPPCQVPAHELPKSLMYLTTEGNPLRKMDTPGAWNEVCMCVYMCICVRATGPGVYVCLCVCAGGGGRDPECWDFSERQRERERERERALLGTVQRGFLGRHPRGVNGYCLSSSGIRKLALFAAEENADFPNPRMSGGNLLFRRACARTHAPGTFAHMHARKMHA